MEKICTLGLGSRGTQIKFLKKSQEWKVLIFMWTDSYEVLVKNKCEKHESILDAQTVLHNVFTALIFSSLLTDLS